MSVFQKARKSRRKLRLTFDGPAGFGKTFTLLSVATGMADQIEIETGIRPKIAVIDTEHGSSQIYANEFDFDVLTLKVFDPRNYRDAIHAAEEEGYEIIGIDSLSHAWTGKGGELNMVDNIAATKRGNSFTAWRQVSPLHNELIESMLQSTSHIIATMRSKVDYAMETDSNGRVTVEKLGLAPIQREGMDYEFDVVIDMDRQHRGVVGKTRCQAIDGQVIDRPGKPLGKMLVRWLHDAPPAASVVPDPPARRPEPEPVPAAQGEEVPPAQEPVKPVPAPGPEETAPEPGLGTPDAILELTPGMATINQIAEFQDLMQKCGIGEQGRADILGRRGVRFASQLSDAQLQEINDKLRAKYEAANPKPPAETFDEGVDAIQASIQAAQPAAPSTDTETDQLPDPTSGEPDPEDDFDVPDVDSKGPSQRALKRAEKEARETAASTA